LNINDSIEAFKKEIQTMEVKTKYFDKQFAHKYERKGVYPDMEFRSTDIARKTGFFINKEEAKESSDKEINMQKTKIREPRGVKMPVKKQCWIG
jgi:hypothetical protein